MPSESKSRGSNNSRSNSSNQHGKKSSSGSSKNPRRSSHHSSGEDDDDHEEYKDDNFGTTTRRTRRPSRHKTTIPPDRIVYSSTMITAENVLEVLPSDYVVKHAASSSSSSSNVEPVLYHLPKLAAGTTAAAAASSGGTTTTFPNLRVLMAAAQEDIRLHRARQQAAKERDLRHLKHYQLEQDQLWLARQQRLNERALLWQELLTQGPRIWKDLQEGPNPKQGLTAHEATQVQLARWQRALEYYVYSPKIGSTTTTVGSTPTSTTSTTVTPKQPTTTEALGMLELLEHLSEGVAEVCIHTIYYCVVLVMSR